MSKCYLCGSIKNLTRDHVPPQGLFPPPLPSDLITLPCCEQCHKPLSLDDEAFRLWVASAADTSAAGRWIFENKVMGSSLMRSPKLHENVRKFVKMRQLQLPDGIVSVPTISIPQKRAENVLIRITKGLLTNFYPDYDFSKDVFKVFCPAPIPKNKIIIQDIMSRCKHDSRGDAVFDVWHGITIEKLGGAWVYLFYHAACCFVTHNSTSKTVSYIQGSDPAACL